MEDYAFAEHVNAAPFELAQPDYSEKKPESDKKVEKEEPEAPSIAAPATEQVEIKIESKDWDCVDWRRT